jgi:ketosteroid isomerase-like protein
MDPSIITSDPILRRVFEALHALVAQDTASWAALFTEDGIMEFPYAPPGYPARLEGRTAIEAYMQDYPSHITLRQVHCDHAYRAGETRIVEFSARCTAVVTGRAFTMRYVAVITPEGDKIKTYRDYWNPLAAMTALGHMDAAQ